ncbi:efflux RND transporter periplasmic adaptor subunit [uncultured Acetobacteroides sp.]|uniref:efflux RND transporter periplasmic adaptor subunit n=1 Tax=uncultured Acetobacteroides sp. TaxID=1760811 RepID=UPI0029F54B0B|nr:efflux RND transporter periplasmic adaptor subunit [uncultured Acetobacteroides sp.]
MKTGFITAIALSIVLAGCSGKPTAESIRKEISDLKTQSFEIDKKITELEKQLATMGTKQAGGLIPVEVKMVNPQNFDHYLELSATVEAENDAMVSPEASGQIKRILVKKGQHVSAGTPLIRLTTEIMDNSIMEVKNQLSLAKDIYEKQKALWDQKVGSEIQYLQAKNNKEALERKLATLRSQLSMSTVKAAFSGVVDDIYQKEGELAMPGQPVLHLVNPSAIKIKAEASESFIGTIKKGQMVDVQFPSNPDLKLKLPVTRVGNVVDMQSRTFPIEVTYSIANNGTKILPNQMATLILKDFSDPKAFVVPSLIVKNDEKGQFLFVAQDTPKGPVAKKVYVKAGLTYQDNSTITSGLKTGDKVIIAGFNQVSSGSPLSVK